MLLAISLRAMANPTDIDFAWLPSDTDSDGAEISASMLDWSMLCTAMSPSTASIELEPSM